MYEQKQMRWAQCCLIHTGLANTCLNVCLSTGNAVSRVTMESRNHGKKTSICSSKERMRSKDIGQGVARMETQDDASAVQGGREVMNQGSKESKEGQNIPKVLRAYAGSDRIDNVDTVLYSDLSHTRTTTQDEARKRWESQQEEVGYVPTYKDDKRKVEHFVRNTLYLNMKFINCKSDLYARGRNTISNYVMTKLNISPSYRQAFWEKQAKNVYHALNQKRANASSDIMKKFTCKSKTVWRRNICEKQILQCTD